MGEGPLYRICKARHGTKYVILKCPVQPETIYIEMLRREYEIGYTLSHPCVVNILGFEGNTELGPALVMEYIDGVTLEEFMKTGPSRQQMRQVMDDILDGVDYLHKRGIVHNDLKPSNIIITSSSRAKIIDFGFSSSEDSAYSGVRGGSDGYTAPEILRGERSILPASDIYSVGKIMKYMGIGPSSVIRRAVSEKVSRRFQCIGDLRKAIGKRRTLFLSAAMLTIAGVLAGAIWALIPAIFKAFFDTNESLFTLMMNYIASGLIWMFLTIWLKNGETMLRPIEKGNIPELGNKYLLPIIIFFLLAVAMYVYLKYSKQGYEISVVGESTKTARYIGINVKKVIIRTLILSGAIAGLVGAVLGGAIEHTVAADTAKNMGFTAIMTAWLANFNPLVMIASCFFISFISKGMVKVRSEFGFTSGAISNIVVGVVYFAVISVSFFITYRIVFRDGAFDGIKRFFGKGSKEGKEGDA